MQTASTTSSRTRTYLSGRPIFWEGEEGDSMYVIRSGKVKVTKKMYGIMVTLADLGPGDYFGEMALLEGVPRSASAIAETQVEADVYDRKALTEMIAADPEFAFTMMRAMSDRLRRIDDRLTDLVAKGRLPNEDAEKLSHNALF